MSPEEKQENPSIKPLDNGPYLVSRLLKLTNSKSGNLEAKESMALCRCGGSGNKPFCDGTHITNGFISEKTEAKVPDKRDNYAGKEITIHDNRGVCSHAGHCTDNLPPVWKLGVEPWIDPDGATLKEIIQTINMCPSGALSYTIKDTEHRDLDSVPEIHVSKDGPYRVRGGVELEGFEHGDGASKEHYTLCRCGGSKNKPRCDGTHWYIKFKDEKN